MSFVYVTVILMFYINFITGLSIYIIPEYLIINIFVSQVQIFLIDPRKNVDFLCLLYTAP